MGLCCCVCLCLLLLLLLLLLVTAPSGNATTASLGQTSCRRMSRAITYYCRTALLADVGGWQTLSTLDAF